MSDALKEQYSAMRTAVERGEITVRADWLCPDKGFETFKADVSEANKHANAPRARGRKHRAVPSDDIAELHAQLARLQAEVDALQARGRVAPCRRCTQTKVACHTLVDETNAR